MGLSPNVISEEVWKRFHLHAGPVRHVQILNEDTFIWALLLVVHGDQARQILPDLQSGLFPHIKSLSCEIDCPRRLEGAISFVNGSLVKIEIDVFIENSVDSFDPCSLLEKLAQVSPTLSRFTMTTRRPKLESSHFWAFVGRLLQDKSDTLRNLALDKDALTYIPEIPIVFSTLTFLEICDSERDEAHPNSAGPFTAPTKFPNLTRLRGYIPSGIPFRTQFISGVGESILDIAFTGLRRCTFQKPSEITKLFSTIAENCPHLRRLRLTGIDLDRSTPKAIIRALYGPLLSCRSLIALYLTICTPLQDLCHVLTDNDLVGMAAAWENPLIVAQGKRLPQVRCAIGSNRDDSITLPFTPSSHSNCKCRRYPDIADGCTNTTEYVTIFADSSTLPSVKDIALWLGDICPAIGVSSADPKCGIQEEVAHLQRHSGYLMEKLATLRAEIDGLRAERDSALLSLRERGQ
jgi:hypothetical protein